MADIYYLSEYNWQRGTLVSSGKKNHRIEENRIDQFGKTYQARIYVAKEKCAMPDEIVCVVWETHRGVNGRGGYRVERDLYPAKRIRADQISRQECTYGPGRVVE